MLGVGRESSLQQTQLAATSFFKENAAALITGAALFAISCVVIALCAHGQNMAQVMGSNLTQAGQAYAIGIPVALVGSVAVTAIMIVGQSAKKTLTVVPFLGVAAVMPPAGKAVSPAGFKPLLAPLMAPVMAPVVAPMDGRCARVAVKVGDQVTRGTPLLILECMKMEMTIRAASSGTVVEILAEQGRFVEGGAPLVRIK